jgi:diguanylate cyclase (GGDEF)-like protein
MDVLRVGLLELETIVDPLTGFFNRRYLDYRLRNEVTAARRYSPPLSLLFLDICCRRPKIDHLNA